MEWMNHYCAAHPLEQLVDATQVLVLELIRRQNSN
jgi:hypothetical protein